MNAYRIPADVPRRDLIAEAAEQVRRERLERRIAWCDHLLGGGVLPLAPRSAPARERDRFDLPLWLVLLAPYLLYAYVVTFLYACAAIVRAWSEWRLLGGCRHPRPIASVCVLGLLLAFGGSSVVALGRAGTWALPITTFVFGVISVVVAHRREWCRDVVPTIAAGLDTLREGEGEET
jgi:hypothetical protein